LQGKKRNNDLSSEKNNVIVRYYHGTN